MKQNRTAKREPQASNPDARRGLATGAAGGGERKIKSEIKRRRTEGFTLIELLLAVAIFAIVLLAINAVFYSALHLERTTSRALDERLPLNQALSVLRRDLQGAVPPNSNGVFICDFKSGAGRGGLGEAGTGSSLEFCTTTGGISDDAPWGELQRVSYQLIEATNPATATGKDLVRVVTRNLLPITTEETDEQWLLGNVESLEFLSYSGTDWRDSWDTTLGDPGLPQAVRVRILLAAAHPNAALRREPLELLVPLTTQARTNLATTGGTGG